MSDVVARMKPADIDEALDSIFGDAQVKHQLTLYPEAARHALPMLVRGGRYYLTCLVSQKVKLARPEEIVRQLELAQLRDELGYDLDQIAIEVRIKMGSSFANKAADIVVYSDSTKEHMHIIIECKKPKRLDGLDQLHSYMNATGVYFGAWVNGGARVNQLRSNPNIFESVKKLPATGETIDDVKSAIVKADLIRLQDLKDEVQYLENTVLTNAGVSTFDEIFKLIFAKLYDESEKGDYEPLDFRTTTESPAIQYKHINAIFREACVQWPDIFGANENIELSPEALVAVASEFQDKRFFDADLDVIDAAFEYLINPEQKGDKGQYFTPRPVVKMCVRMLNPKESERVLDPACGPAGFLIHTLNWVSTRYLTAKYKSNFETKKSQYAGNRLFGIDFDARLMRVARAMMLIAGDGRSNIFRVSALDPREWLGRDDGLVHSIPDAAFDVIMTNPPFAGSIKQPEVLGRYDLAYKGSPGKTKRANSVSRDVLFVERCMKFLKPGGRMALVLPQGNFNNVSAEYLRTYLRAHGRILAVVSLSANTFQKFTNTKNLGYRYTEMVRRFR
ncbi:restriction endonuclease subunit M [uncultured Jatrophihabitans sp.]|uniref:restriction endonuclease subunit M n=1 Tax=uncultured Jatrophihabitans sp. TaxID=1610747 RepID=UPI0035CB38AB